MLELRHVGKAYGEHAVLSDIDLTIEDGQIVSILGPSGGGKTTLLNVLLGITEATSSQILWNGQDFTHVPMEKRGYKPDFMITPDGVGGKGRPYPYMVFRNLEALGVTDVRRAAKVGDTVSDINEGKHAGVLAIGVVEGSSEMGLSLEEYEALSASEKDAACEKVAATFHAAGADAVIRNFSELPALLAQLA